ncbi:polysaccharide deacetylase [Hydrogenothermus marinus]|uniref:Polysaccharide deacetylase n=2 Tax=Hydrogenothermus marinus TaxID=133270 RepID=A0A3M0BM10_9AQUI|nr:polysaccharide deacetylase [Hydrogenothermus marinus]
MIIVSLSLPTQAQNKYAVILIYHKFDNPKYPSTSIPIKDFEAQMRYLKENNYNVVSLDKIIDYIKNGYIPPKTVSITIDDGYKSTMKAFKILKKYNFPFTLFLYMEAIGRYPDFLSYNQINQLKKYRKITFGNHSYTHFHFPKVKKGFDKNQFIEKFREDTLKAEKSFIKIIGYKPKYYAYPYGEYNELMVKVLKDLGYKAAFTQDPSSVYTKNNLYIIPRQPIVGHWGTLKHFKKILNIEPLPVIDSKPSFGNLKKNPPDKIMAKIKNLQDYKNCGIYISELGWIKAKRNKDTIYVENIPKLKRWKNRIGFTCFDKKTKKSASFFYMVINPQ